MLVVLIGFAGLFGVYAYVRLIESNVVHEAVSDYTVALASSDETPLVGQTVRFTATLQLNGQNVGEGKTIHFFRDSQEVGLSLTNSSGMAIYDWLADSTCEFQAKYEAQS